MEALRVHIAGVGYQEVDRVVFPLREMRAEKVYLLAHVAESSGGRASRQRREIARRLTTSNIDAEEVTTDLWDAAAVASTIRRIMRTEPGNEYRFNVSTGPKTCVIGGFLASMFWPIRLYYVEVDYKAEDGNNEFNRYPAKSIAYIPTFHAAPPRRKAIEALAVLAEQEWSASQSELSQILQQMKIIRPANPEAEMSPQAAHSQMQSIVDSLRSLGFVERHKGGATSELVVTEEGKAAHRMFSGFLNELR